MDELEEAFTNGDNLIKYYLIGCFRNISSGGGNVRRRILRISGLQNFLAHAIKCKSPQMSSENCLCLLRNLSFRVSSDSFSRLPK